MELPADINPGIRKTVELLNQHGWHTTDSGDGQTHLHACDRAVGYVVVLLQAEQRLAESSHEILDLLEANGVQFDPAKGPFIQASYSPLDGARLVDIHDITDAMLRADANFKL